MEPQLRGCGNRTLLKATCSAYLPWRLRAPHSVVGFSFRVERAEGSENATGIALRAPQALFTLSRCSQECFCLGECDIVAMKAVAPL